VPWARDRVEAPAPEPTPTLGELALRLSLAEVAAGAREDPPGSDRTDPKYWAGCTRTVGKTEVILKLDRGPWCAGGFQWATYEAARQLGLLDGKDQALAWLAGPGVARWPRSARAPGVGPRAPERHEGAGALPPGVRRPVRRVASGTWRRGLP